MKVFSKIIIVFLLLYNSVNAQTTAIPDAIFEQQLIDLSIDTNGLNGNILNTDAQSVTNLATSVNTITDFTGLEAFTNVLTLNLGNNQFTTLPLTTLTLLEELVFDNNDALASLDLSSNTALKKLDIGSLISGLAPHPPIANLDLSTNILLEDLSLNLFINITSLTLPITNTLKKIDILRIAVPTIDLSLLGGLEDFKIAGSEVPLNLIFPNEQNVLKRVHLSGITFLTVDVSNYVVLERLQLFSTAIENLILPTTNTFTNLLIWVHNFINPVSLAAVPNITHLDIRNNDAMPLVIDISTNLQLTNISLDNNDMNTVNLTHNILLERLNISSNNLILLDVTQNILLERLRAVRNQLPTIDLSQNIELKSLALSHNQLPTLDVTHNNIIEDITIDNNLFTTTGLDLTHNTVLRYFHAAFNQIESLNISQNPELSFLILNNNLFTGNDILNQYYQIRQADGGIRRGILDVAFNQLSGVMPNYASLVHLGGGNLWTNRFQLKFNDNAFEFGDFENQHLDYVSFLTTPVPHPHNTTTFTEYHYAPQAKVNNIENFTRNAGDNITLTTVVSGAQNHYKWFKNGVEIVGAPDSPNYTITDLNSCDAAVYYCEITSDLVPFENPNLPGTDNKNLLLVRNDITLTINTTKTCVVLINPLNSSVEVPINTGIEWSENAGACGYKISVGTTSGGTDIVNNEDVGEVNLYNFASDLPSNTVIFVTIIPYFDDGDLAGCIEESFTTNATTVVPDCTTLSNPINNATSVLTTTDLHWNPANAADGYHLSVGTSSGATDILNNQDLGNVTTYNLPTDLPENTQIFVTVIPYNTVGDATSCIEEIFTTETIATVPTCTALTSPLNGATNVSIGTDLDWASISNATGYRLSVGTSSGATDIINNQDLGNVTTYNLPLDLPENTQIFVSIIPYNAIGDATSCTEESFTTETVVTIPNCTALTTPLNGATNVSIGTDLDWASISNATGYRLSVGTSSGATDILNNQDLGNVTTYDLPLDLPENTQIFVSIIPYNAVGDATSCTEESFITDESLFIDETKYGFSPDGDGINDFWEIVGIENHPSNTVTIYNRWGDLVFEVNGYNNASQAFYGNANKFTQLGAKELPEGTYFFDIKISGAHNFKKLRGFLVLKR